MLDRVAITVAPLRMVVAALVIWLTASIAYVASSSRTPHEPATNALVSCAHSELCAAVIAAPVCASVRCAAAVECLIRSQSSAVVRPFDSMRTRTLRMNPRFMMRRLPAEHPITR